MEFYPAIDAVRDGAVRRTLPDGGRLWSTIVKQIGDNGYFDGKLADMLEEIIGSLLKNLHDAQIIELWRDSEMGMTHDGDAEDFLADSLRMDLEMELLDETVKLAYEEGKVS